MNNPLKPADAAALLAAQGIEATPEGAEAHARFVTQQLGHSAKEFAQLDFEAEPAGYVAALRTNTR